MSSFSEMQYTATKIFSAYASITGTLMVFRSMANEMVPENVKSFLYSVFQKIFDRFFTKMPKQQMTVVVDEQVGISRNQIYDAAEVYLRTIINPEADRLKVNKTLKQKSITLSMEKDQEVFDSFTKQEADAVQLKWQFVLIEPGGENRRFQQEKRHFELSFEKRHKDVVLSEYLPHVLAKAKEIKSSERAVKLYTRDCPTYDNDDDEGGNGGGGYWGCVNLDHPVTFEKLAMEPKLKKAIIDDLDRFLRRKDYYRRVGKAWKRGYLLYGPPGTGKSSLIAAIANYLRFDVYDLELASVYSNADLRRTLLCTNNKSIIVIEDIDCSSNMQDRSAEESDQEETHSDTKLTLSGVLNFIDGLWSACGDERIIIFTTNHKEKLDPALLRPGRIDMHVYMGYCTVDGFDVLASNYLGIDDHPRFFPVIKELIREVEITPAEVAEHLMRSEDAELALEGVIDLLRLKKHEKITINNRQRQQIVENGNEAKVKDADDVNGDCGKEKKRKKGRFVKVMKSLSELGSKSRSLNQ